ncbi:hypothetical protein C8F01DRAFT_1151871 [Mycena amicta]|nr:hypothetical protein C8F01DRAFT_1151871 [Mycena amicta]
MDHLQHAEGLYFQDCGLVLQAEDMLFRVSSDFLATQSTFFRDMLSLPIPPDAETTDGGLLVRVQDSAADMSAFLRALIYPNFFQAPPAATSFAIVSPVARLSHKYMVDWLHKRALSHLAVAYPTTLDGWHTMLTTTTTVTTNPNFMSGAAPELLLSALILARQLSVDWMLPAAFYRVARIKSPATIFDSEILPADKLRYLEAIRKLDRHWCARSLEFLWEPPVLPGCTRQRRCSDVRLECRAEAEHSYGYDVYPNYSMPLDNWAPNDWTTISWAVCAPCLTEMKQMKATADQAFWDDLPDIFGLGNWAALEQMKRDALENSEN